MKIIEPGELIVDTMSENRARANRGCHQCPNCGCTTIHRHSKKPKGIPRNNGIYQWVVADVNLIPFVYGNIDHYECTDCSCVWESKMYNKRIVI